MWVKTSILRMGKYVARSAAGVRWPRIDWPRLQNLVQEKQIREQRAEMNRRVEVVHELGADRRLGLHEADGGQRGLGVAVEHGQKRFVPVITGFSRARAHHR